MRRCVSGEAAESLFAKDASTPIQTATQLGETYLTLNRTGRLQLLCLMVANFGPDIKKIEDAMTRFRYVNLLHTNTHTSSREVPA